MLRSYGRSFILFLIIPIAIFLANLYLVTPLFSGEYTQWIGSIETAFVAQAKFVIEHFPNLSFFPYWYTGFPFHLFHTPLLVTLVVLLSKIASSVSVAHSYRIITAVSYSLVPVSIYFLGRKLGRSTFSGIIAALLYSFWPSASILLSKVAQPTALYHNLPWRFTILNYYGEGPHTLSLVFIPLAALFFWKTLEKVSKQNVILASIFITLSGLASTFGLISLVILLIIMTAVKSLTNKNWALYVKSLFIIGLISFGLSSFWYNLSFFNNLFAFSDATSPFSGQITLLFFFLILSPLFILLIKNLLKFVPKSMQGLISLAFWILLFFFVITIWESNRIALLPQAIRYAIELDIGTSLAAGVAAGMLIKYIYDKTFLTRILAIFLVILFLVPTAKYFLDIYPNMQKASQPHQDISTIYEYKIAQIIEDDPAIKRVYLAGNYSFWLNTFIKTPQLRGGGDQSIVNSWVKHAIYQINTGSDGEIALAWLKIFNIDTIVVNLPSSPNIYKDFKVPSKFNLLGQPIYEDHGDQIFKVPLKNSSLVKTVSLSKFESLQEPFNAIDKEPILNYLSWLEESEVNSANIKKIDNDHYEIEVDVKEDEAILVHFSYDPGWKAKSNIGPVRLQADTLGQLLVIPNQKGEQIINLNHSTSTNQFLGYLITIATLIILASKLLNKLFTSKGN